MATIDTTAPVITITREEDGPWIITSTDGLSAEAPDEYDAEEVLAMAERVCRRTYAWHLTNDGFVSVGAIED